MNMGELKMTKSEQYRENIKNITRSDYGIDIKSSALLRIIAKELADIIDILEKGQEQHD